MQAPQGQGPRRQGKAAADDDEKLATSEIADMITADSHFAVDLGGRLYVFRPASISRPARAT